MDDGADPVKQFNVYLPASLIREVKHHAVDTERSLSSITAEALTVFLEQAGSRRRAATREGKRDVH